MDVDECTMAGTPSGSDAFVQSESEPSLDVIDCVSQIEFLGRGGHAIDGRRYLLGGSHGVMRDPASAGFFVLGAMSAIGRGRVKTRWIFGVVGRLNTV